MAQALAAGEIQVGGVGLGNFLGLAQGGKVDVIAVSAPNRSPLVPDVMTFEESGLGAYTQRGWWGLATPNGTPKPIVDRLNAEFVRLFNDPTFVAFLDKQAVVAAPTTPEAFAAFVRRTGCTRRTCQAREHAAHRIQAGAALTEPVRGNLEEGASIALLRCTNPRPSAHIMCTNRASGARRDFR